MATITGNLKHSVSNTNLAAVTARLEKGDGTTWVAFSSGQVTATASDSAGNYSVTYAHTTGTYLYVRLSFVGTNGVGWEIAPGTASEPTTWDRTQPPTTLNARLVVPELPRVPAEQGGLDTTPSVIAGSLVDRAAAARAGVEVRLREQLALQNVIGTTHPGSFFTHEIGPPGNPGPGLQAAADWAARRYRQGDILVVILQLPASEVANLERAGLVRTRSVPGLNYGTWPNETIFDPASFDGVNRAASFLYLRF